MAELADADAEASETIKLKLFQEVENLGLNSSQTVNTNLSLLRCSSPAVSAKIFYGDVAQW